MSSIKTVRRISALVEKLYPKELADKSWDNTGLLLSCPLEDSHVSAEADKNPSVLLTIDLTAGVADEAIRNSHSMVVAYHPFIFRGLKSITQQDPQQRSLLRLARAGISVYCPHTAIDAAVGGVNDWLADGVSGGSKLEKSRSVLQPVTGVSGHEGAGMGRLVTLAEPVSLQTLVSRVKAHLGLNHVQIAQAPRHASGDLVHTIALCAGSGGEVFKGAKADIYLTGELSHHELLYMVETGTSAIVCGHSNTERGFLEIFKQQLLREFATEDASLYVAISEADHDPLTTA